MLMRYFVGLLLFLFCCSSCASLMNQPSTEMRVFTTEPSLIVVDADTFKTIRNQVVVDVERKEEPVEIIAITDTITKKVCVPAKKSAAFLMNIPLNYGIGILIDADNPKRFGYPRVIHLNSADTINRYYKFGLENNKNVFRFNISLPHINIFEFKPEGESIKNTTGFFGISFGLDYFYNAKKFINISTYRVTDFPFIVPVAYDRFGPYENMRSSFTTLSHNHQFKRLTVGYGLSYSKNTWSFNPGRQYPFEDMINTEEAKRKISYAVGAVVPVHFRLGQSFHFGVIYRPTFYRANISPTFKYEHLISVDFAWKIRLKD